MEDIVIVGAGPTGLALAEELLRRGIRPAVYDRLAAQQNTSRAVVVHARTLEVLEPSGVTVKLLAEGIRADKFHVRERDREIAAFDLNLLAGETKYPYALIIPQDRTEALLLEALEARGGKVTRPAEVVRVEPASASVRLTLQHDDRTESVEAAWVVACDGGHSIVRQAAGIPFEGGDYEEEFVLGDLTMDCSLGHDEGQLFLSPEGIVVVVPLPQAPDRFRVIATVKTNAPQNPPAELFQQILSERGPSARPAQVKTLVWSSRFHVHHRVAKQLRSGRILLAGDAAHVHSPAGGQGMNTGIQDAVSLAEALAQMLQSGNEAALDKWEKDRLRIARGVVSMTDVMTRIATVDSPLLRSARNALMELVGHIPALQHAMAEKISELKNR
jgi:2-polyprenyl-6-methoxyphenol hydroxylase-like FAD-dependent oxidoreductase